MVTTQLVYSTLVLCYQKGGKYLQMLLPQEIYVFNEINLCTKIYQIQIIVIWLFLNMSTCY